MPMIDDMEGLFSHASDAYRAGQMSGRADLFKTALTALGLLSLKFEKTGDVSAFRAAEEACAALRRVNETLNRPKPDPVPGDWSGTGN